MITGSVMVGRAEIGLMVAAGAGDGEVIVSEPLTALSEDGLAERAGAAVVGVGHTKTEAPRAGRRRPRENSEVLPMASVAVAVTIRPTASGTEVTLKVALPLASVVTLAKPRNCCPSAGRPSGSGLLAKNSMRYVELGAAL